MIGKPRRFRVTMSKEYKKILEHRKTCSSWKLWSENKSAPLCLDCFGGGLTIFSNKILDEFERIRMIEEQKRVDKTISSFKRRKAVESV